MPKAYSYLRFSTPEQSLGDSKRRQLQLAQDYCARHGLTLDDSLSYQDLGVSAYRGKHAQKGSLGDFLEAVKVGQVEPGSYLLVEALDRISRQQQWDATQTLGAIVQEGVTIVTLAPERRISRQTLNNEPMLLFEVILGFQLANQESAQKARRIKESWKGRRAVADKKKLTSTSPGWLTLDKTKGKWVVDKERANVVRRIFRDTAKGIGQNAIAEALNTERVPLFGKGKHWHRSYIAKLLDSPSVIGTYVPHSVEYLEGKRTRKPAGDPIPNYYPRIIDDDLYQRVQAQRLTVASVRTKATTTGAVRNLFGGLMICALCGDTVTRTNKGKPPKGAEYLVCQRAKTGAGCKYKAVRYDVVEYAAVRQADTLISEAPSPDEEAEREVASVDALLLELSDAIENTLRTIEKGQQSAALSANLQRLEAEQEKARKKRDQLQARQSVATGPLREKRIAELHDALTTKPLERAKANGLMRQVFRSVMLDHRNHTLTFEWQQGGQTQLLYGMEPATKPKKRSAAKKRR
jgi:DNA invertase Pin-like site-specific DNA recombinase